MDMQSGLRRLGNFSFVLGDRLFCSLLCSQPLLDFLKRFSLAIFILLPLVCVELHEKSPDPHDPNLLRRWLERENWEENRDF